MLVCQFGPKMAQMRPKMAKMRPKMAKMRLKMPKMGPKMAKMGPNMAKMGPKMAKMSDQNPILEPLGSQEPKKEWPPQSSTRIRALQKTPGKRPRACMDTRSCGDQNVAPRSIEGGAVYIWRGFLSVRKPPREGDIGGG